MNPTEDAVRLLHDSMAHLRSFTLAGSLAALASTFFASCSRDDGAPLSVVLITLDTTRRDALGCYGESSDATPALDRVAEEGVLYLSAYTVAPLTLPAHASMLTGLYPVRHTVRDNDHWVLPTEAHTLAEAAHEAGFETAAFVASAVLDASAGLAQGFEHYSEGTLNTRVGERHPQRSAQHVVDDALAWLGGRDAERPFLLWLHFFDPHAPYSAPGDFGTRSQDAYLNEVAFMDHEIGRLLNTLRDNDLLSQCLLLVAADHGEARGDKGEQTHGLNCFQSTLHVGMMLRYPDGHRAGERSEEIVSVVDVFPTLADAMGLEYGEDLDGKSLYRKTISDSRGVYFESYAGYFACGHSQVAGWLDAAGKYTHSSDPSLYDLSTDPGELVNLLADRPADVERYRRNIAAVAQRTVLPVDSTETANEERLATLRSLGYAGAGGAAADVPHPLDDLDRPSPHSQSEEYDQLMEGVAMVLRGRFAQALPIFESQVRANPYNVVALEQLATCLIRLNRWTEAIAPLQKLLEQRPTLARWHFQLAACLWAKGRFEECVQSAERAIALRPDNRNYYGFLISIYEEKGMASEAERWKRRLSEQNEY